MSPFNTSCSWVRQGSELAVETPARSLPGKRDNGHLRFIVVEDSSHPRALQSWVARWNKNKIVVVGRHQRVRRFPKGRTIFDVVGQQPVCPIPAAVEVHFRLVPPGAAYPHVC